MKHAAKNPIDVTQAFYSRPPPKQQLLSNPSSHLCVGKACLHHSHSLLTRSPSPKHPTSGNPDGTPLTLKQRQIRQKHYDEFKKTTPCHACGNTGHWKGECPNLTEAERQSYRKKPPHSLLSSSTASAATRALTASELPEADASIAFMASISDVTSDIWYVDSAASSHLTGRHEWFTNF